MRGIKVCESEDLSAVAEVFQVKYVLIAFVIAFFYIAITVYLLNYRFFIETVLGRYSILYKFAVFKTLLEGSFTAFSLFDSIFLVILSLLIGINSILLIVSAKRFQGAKIKFFVGGGGILGIASTGCASCGFSVLSVLGISAGFLNASPFGNKTLYVVSITALIFSIFYMVRKLAEGASCKAGIKMLQNDRFSRQDI